MPPTGCATSYCILKRHFQHDHETLPIFVLPPLPAPESRPSRVLPVPPRFECRHGNATEGGMAEGLAAARYSYHSGGSGFQNSPRQPTGEHPPAAHASGYGSHLRRMDDRPGGDRFNMFDAQSNGQSGPMHGDRSCSHVGSELPLRVDTFGYMAPCWRIIESAQAYVDKVCIMHHSVVKLPW